MPARRITRLCLHAASRLKRKQPRRSVLGDDETEASPFQSAGIVGGFRGNEVSLAIVQQDNYEFGVEKRSDDQIRELVTVDVSRRNLHSPGRTDKTDSGLMASTEIEVDRILRGGRSVAGDPDQSQIGLAVAVKVSDSKLRRTQGDGGPDEARDRLVRILKFLAPCPKAGDQAQNRDGGKKESVDEAAQAHCDASVYRTIPRGW